MELTVALIYTSHQNLKSVRGRAWIVCCLDCWFASMELRQKRRRSNFFIAEDTAVDEIDNVGHQLQFARPQLLGFHF